MARKSVATRPAEVEFEPALTPKEGEEAESRMNGAGDVAVLRRITIMVLTRTKAQMMDTWKDDPEMMFSIVENVRSFIDHTKGTLELAQAASARLLGTGQIVHPCTPNRGAK